MKKKNRAKLAAIADADGAKSRQLSLTPQIAVAMGPDGELYIEQSNGVGRSRVILTESNAYGTLHNLLLERTAEILAEREAVLRAAQKPKPRPQPNWRLIAKHPGVDGTSEIREITGPVTVIPTRAGQLTALKSDKSLAEMDL